MNLAGFVNQLEVALGGTLGLFVIAVVLDDVAGVVLAIKTHVFDWNKLPKFLESQFGTAQAAALAGLVATAVGAALLTHFASGADVKSLLADVAEASLTAATAGAGALTLSVGKDLIKKIAVLFGSGTLAGYNAPVA